MRLCGARRYNTLPSGSSGTRRGPPYCSTGCSGVCCCGGLSNQNASNKTYQRTQSVHYPEDSIRCFTNFVSKREIILEILEACSPAGTYPSQVWGFPSLGGASGSFCLCSETIWGMLLENPFALLSSCLPDVCPSDMGDSAEPCFTTLWGHIPKDRHGRTFHWGKGHNAECHAFSCAGTGYVSEKGRGPTHARTSGKHPKQSRARLAVKKWEEAEPLWPSRASSFHFTSNVNVFSSHLASVPGTDNACPLTLPWVHATTVPG